MAAGRLTEALVLLQEADRFWREFDSGNRWAGDAAFWLGRCQTALRRHFDARSSPAHAAAVRSGSPFVTDTTRLPYGLDLSGANWPNDTKMALVPCNNALTNGGVQQLVALQDNWNYATWLSTQPILDAKWAVVKAFLDATVKTPVTAQQLCINFLSAAGSWGPYTIATGGYHNPEAAKDVHRHRAAGADDTSVA